MVFLVTTSHRPSQRTRSFVKDLASVLPGGLKTNRGKKTLQDLALEALENKCKRVIIVLEKRGNPSALRIYDVDGENVALTLLFTIILGGVKLSRENPEAIRAYNPTKLAAYPQQAEEVIEELTDVAVKAFLAKLVFSIDEACTYDVVICVERSGRSLFYVFRNPSTRKVVGPIMKILRVVDHVSGRRIPHDTSGR